MMNIKCFLYLFSFFSLLLLIVFSSNTPNLHLACDFRDFSAFALNSLISACNIRKIIVRLILNFGFLVWFGFYLVISVWFGLVWVEFWFGFGLEM